jgi:hypothetical protein
MAPLASLPVELLTNILSLAIEPVWIEDYAVVGLGMPTHRLTQVSRAWREICLALPAQVPMKKKKRKDGGRREESWEPEVDLLSLKFLDIGRLSTAELPLEPFSLERLKFGTKFDARPMTGVCYDPDSDQGRCRKEIFLITNPG